MSATAAPYPTKSSRKESHEPKRVSRKVSANVGVNTSATLATATPNAINPADGDEPSKGRSQMDKGRDEARRRRSRSRKIEYM